MNRNEAFNLKRARTGADMLDKLLIEGWLLAEEQGFSHHQLAIVMLGAAITQCQVAGMSLEDICRDVRVWPIHKEGKP